VKAQTFGINTANILSSGHRLQMLTGIVLRSAAGPALTAKGLLLFFFTLKPGLIGLFIHKNI
jgi:hypothetical protein